jgi:hypothetical protein
MECLAMTTRAVRVQRDGHTGRIFFAGGQIVHAEYDDLKGEPALFALLRWPGGNFSVEDGLRPLDDSINRDWHSLLLEAAQFADEQAAPSPNPTPTTMTAIPMTPAARADAFRDPEVKSAVQFTEDGTLLEARADDPETMQATFAFVAQLLRLVGGNLGAEHLREIQIHAPDQKAL